MVTYLFEEHVPQRLLLKSGCVNYIHLSIKLKIDYGRLIIGDQPAPRVFLISLHVERFLPIPFLLILMVGLLLTIVIYQKEKEKNDTECKLWKINMLLYYYLYKFAFISLKLLIKYHKKLLLLALRLYTQRPPCWNQNDSDSLVFIPTLQPPNLFQYYMDNIVSKWPETSPPLPCPLS